MTEERIKEFIPELEKYTFVSHDKIIAIEGENTWLEDDSAYGEFSKYTESLKQTDQLREAVNFLLEWIKMVESLPHFIEVDSYEYMFRNNAIKAIESIMGKPYEEIKGE